MRASVLLRCRLVSFVGLTVSLIGDRREPATFSAIQFGIGTGFAQTYVSATEAEAYKREIQMIGNQAVGCINLRF